MTNTDSPTLRIRQSSWLWPVAVLLLSIVWQLHTVLHGLDLTDEGYLMSVYQWFGTDITAAKGAGGYPLTCWLGWFVAHYLPGNGLLAMRLWGVALVTLTEVIAYLWLRRWFSSRLLLVGLFIQLVFVSGDPKPLGYNTLTGLFYLLALIATIEAKPLLAVVRQWHVRGSKHLDSTAQHHRSLSAADTALLAFP